ncbi:CCR4-NOT transcription complex subunit 1-like [Halichondria panicea]|uniref:CCR4-NOT transcription complex subunit 1-like n=1 Tax=Halichondria panicea TaxID=6063 RepID=UPI00312BB2E4
MSLSPCCYALSQISSLVVNITKKNYKANCSEIAKLVDTYGPEADRHLFRCLISSIDFANEGRNSGKEQLQLLSREAAALVTKPDFVSILCYAFEKQESKSLRPSSQPLSQVAKMLKLGRVQEVVFALGLTSSTDPEMSSHASQYLRSKLPELVRSYSDLSSGFEGGFGDTAIEVLHLLLSYLLQGSEEEVCVAKESVNTFVQTLRRDFPRERVPVVLAPLLYRDQLDITEDRLVPVSVSLPSSVFSVDLADVLKEIGYAATASKQEMMDILKDYGKPHINTKQVAKVLGMMANTLSGLPESMPFMGGSSDLLHGSGKSPTSWDTRVFISCIQSLHPSLNWREVVQSFDYPGFLVPSPDALSLIVTAYNQATRDSFPLDCLYILEWRNTKGQLSWIRAAIRGCSEFSVAQFPLACIPQGLVEELKINLTVDEALTWRSCSLMDTLLALSEQGHYEEVMSVFTSPIKKCPELIFLTAIKAKRDWYMAQQEIISQLLPLFITNHPTYSALLQEAWHGANNRPDVQSMLVQAMSDWYMSGDTTDHTRMARILDVAQEVKALPPMLDVNQFPFVIDLACWAAKREFLKLDKWVIDKLKEYQESFVSECLQFLSARAPKKVVQSEKSGFTHDIICTILSCLQSYITISPLPSDLVEKLRALITVHGPLPQKPRPQIGPQTTLGGMPSPLDLGNITPVSLSMGFSGGGNSTGMLGTPGSPGKQGFNTMQHQTLFGNSSPDPFNLYMSGGTTPTGVASSPIGGPLPKLPPSMMQHQHQITKQVSNEPIGFGPEQTFSKEVDDKANAYFQAIYNRGMTVDQLLDMLKQFKDSNNKKEKDLYVCMLRNMFEEYKFFPQFPEKELQITGQLFGGIIEHELVTYMSLSLALRYVLESLKKPPSSKMYLFGLAALDKFKSRLHEFSQYCASISSIPHFPQFPPMLIRYVQYGQHGQQSTEPPSMIPFSSARGNNSSDPHTPLTMPHMPNILPPLSMINTNPQSSPTFQSLDLGMGSPLSSPVGGGGQLSPATLTLGAVPKGKMGPGSSGSPGRKETPSINTTNIDTLLVAADRQQSESVMPPDELQDKVHFLFNNLSSSNLSDKAEEFRGLVEEEHFNWVAQYLVMKRASIEPNFHSLYIGFLDVYSSHTLRRVVLLETHRNIKVILQADKTSNNFSDRAILKNLGHWLGMQTLGKNKPILQNDLAVKDLILEACEKGQQDLLYVVPFVAKVVESCAESRVFKPPNPWTMGIMAVLSELHSLPNLKLNLRFEIEVLCKHLLLEISDVSPCKLIGDTEKLKNIIPQLGIKSKPESDNNQPPSQSTVVGASQTTTHQPQFRVEDINVTSLAGLSPHIQISPQIGLFQQYPHLKQCVKPSIEKAVQDLLLPVAERSIKIAVTTTDSIIRKDFSLDPDIHRMHIAAHNMVRHLTAGMALITCREPLLMSISSNLKSAFTSAIRTPTEELKSLIDQAANQISADNTELACAFIQKTSMEKATPEVDKRLAEEFDLRKQARNEGRRYCNAGALTYQAERMPEQIRLNVGGPTQQAAAVYEEFGRSLPGFLPSTSSKEPAKTEFVPTEDFLALLVKCIQDVSRHLSSALAPPSNPHVLMMRSLLEMVMQLRLAQNYLNIIGLLQKALEGLLEGMNPPPSDPELFISFRDCHLLILKMIQSHSGLGPEAAMAHVTRILLGAREDIKYSPRAIILLIGLQIVDMRKLDEHLAKVIETGRHLVALSCSIKLVNAIVSAEKRETPITDKDLRKTKETLIRLAASVKLLPDSSAQLLEPFRMNHEIQLQMGDLERAPGGPANVIGHSSAAVTPGATSDLEDPPGLYEKVEYLLSEWVRHFHQPGLLREGDKIYAAYIARLQQQGILKSDDLITRFFRISVEMCVDLCYRTLTDPAINATMARAKCYHTMDAFVKLVVVLVRYSGDAANTVTKVNLLNKVLVTVAHVLLHDHESRHGEFHQLAYHRFFIMLLNDLSSPDPVFDSISFPMLHAFSHVYHIIRPGRAPGFAYSWLELISHRSFIAKLLLQTPQQKGWPLFHQLLIDLFKFLAPFLRNAELTKPTQALYKGTLRVLLVLLHDFPEFLCDYHFSFCDVIPPNCIQMRNLILSAFPRNMRLPDPFTPNLKVEMLPDIAHAPRILPPYSQHIPQNLKKDLDNYIRTRAPVTFLQELRGHLTISSDPGNQYNITLMNALVLYVGTQAIAYVHSKGITPSTSTIAHTAHMDIFQHLVVDLDTEGRYLFLNAIANQLRYPNSHTHYFSCALLSLFSETNVEAIQEQVTRVLLERLIVNRPHPWGLLITFIELIKNAAYSFWKHEFVHCAPEIEKLFGSVAKSCMQKQPQTVGGGTSQPGREVDTHD